MLRFKLGAMVQECIITHKCTFSTTVRHDWRITVEGERFGAICTFQRDKAKGEKGCKEMGKFSAMRYESKVTLVKTIK